MRSKTGVIAPSAFVRRPLSAAEVLLITCLVLTCVLVWVGRSAADWHMETILTIAFLAIAAGVLGTTSVPLDAGVLTLGAIPALAAAAVLSPLGAAIVGISANFARTYANRSRYRVPQFFTSAAWAAVGATSRAVLSDVGVSTGSAMAGAIVIAVATNIGLTILLLAASGNGPLLKLVRQGLSKSMLLAYACFALAAGVCATLIQPTLLAFLQLAVIFFLSSFVVRSLDDQQQRVRLAQQLADAHDRAAFGHAMEAVLHRLKNLVSVASANLDEAMLSSHAGVHARSASAAMSEATDILRKVGVAGRELFTPRFRRLDLAALVQSIAAEVVPVARQSGVRISVDELSEPSIEVVADEGLLRDVLVNLIRNGIDHAGVGGIVAIAAGPRENAWRYVEVRDSGPGVPVSALDTLFVGRASESTTGAGLGLVASYVIVRQHYGKLVYEGSRRRGAIFTVLLPPPDDLERRLSR